MTNNFFSVKSTIGSTWAQEMVWCICNDLDFVKAKSMIGQLRTPLLE